MEPTLTEDDVSKTIIDANGDHIGSVAAVEDGAALVEPVSEVPPTVAMSFGWIDDADSYPLPATAIDTITESGVYLRSSL